MGTQLIIIYVFSEILRLYPALPATGLRKVLEDGVTVGGYNLQNGCIPMINTAAIHHNPKYWIEGYDATKHQNVNMFDIHTEFWLDEDGAFVKKRQSGISVLHSKNQHDLDLMFCDRPFLHFSFGKEGLSRTGAGDEGVDHRAGNGVHEVHGGGSKWQQDRYDRGSIWWCGG